MLIFISILWCYSLEAKDLHVFFIHGLGSSPEAFCDMPEALQHHYTKRGYNLKTKALSYSTQNDELIPLDFVKEITQQIQDYYASHNLEPDAPYSFVVHSQGGIVGLKYLYAEVRKCYHENPQQDRLLKRNCEVPYNFQDFVSFGTPFWGSQGASTSQNKVIDGAIKGFSGMYRQMEQLRVGSLSLGNSRQMMLSKVTDQGEWRHPIPGKHNIRFHNLVGDIMSYLEKGMNAFDRFTKNIFGYSLQDSLLGGGEQEFDIIVSPTGGRVDFNYVIEKNESTPAVTGRTKLGHSYFVAPLSHIDLDNVGVGVNFKNKFSEIDTLKGMACKKGLEIEEEFPNRHLGLQYLIKILDQYYSNQAPKPLNLPWFPKNQGVNNFTVDMQIHIPSGFYRRPQLDLKSIKITQLEKGKLWKEVLQSGALVRGIGFNDDGGEDFNKKYLSFYHDGRFNQEYSETCCKWDSQSGEEPPGTTIRYSIEAEGFEKKQIDVPVDVSYSSFVKVYLKPYRPFKKRTAIRWIRQDAASLKAGHYVVSLNRLSADHYLAAVINPLAEENDGEFQMIFMNQEEISSMGQEFLDQVSQCKVGVAAASHTHDGIKGSLLSHTQGFSHVFDPEPKIQLALGQKIRVLGRVFRDARQGDRVDWDRYLVARPEDPENMFWVKVADIDIMKDLNCRD